MMRCLVKLGASVEGRDSDGDTLLMGELHLGHYSTVQFLLEEGGARIEEVDADGDTAWDLLTARIMRGMRADVEEANPVALTALLREMVLHCDPTSLQMALLSLENMPVVQQGSNLRARLPAYSLRQRAVLDAHLTLLPPLSAIVHGYMKLTTEEVYATGLPEAL
jgi:hypothetical protein